MGKSDPFVFDWYKKHLPKSSPKKIAILGSISERFVRQTYPDAHIDLFDMQLNNWEINQTWNISENTYDLVVCTRCAYFAKDPVEFIRQCKAILRDGGFAFIDWGLGDHWRFNNFKVGWIKDGEHEFAQYADSRSFLYSCIWSDLWENIKEVEEFKINIRSFGYYEHDLSRYVKNEVPKILTHVDDIQKVEFLTLWPDRPQLYILTLIEKNES